MDCDVVGALDVVVEERVAVSGSDNQTRSGASTSALDAGQPEQDGKELVMRTPKSEEDKFNAMVYALLVCCCNKKDLV
tara:strand:- start:55 stop:288 length:234 start_codon:yes stop_codon:yes gene_type:complete